MTAVGVLGGSFDPVHRGHVALALQALRDLRLTRVLLLPCAVPPHKPGRSLAARHHRLEMLYLALQDRAGLSVSTLEIARGGVHYTIDTLRALRDGADPVAPVFICGSDALAEIDSWRDYEALLREFEFAAVPRARGDSAAGAPSVGPPPGGRVVHLAMPPIDVSSSLIRSRCSRGERVDDLVPASVARYIHRHRLYAEEVVS